MLTVGRNTPSVNPYLKRKPDL